MKDFIRNNLWFSLCGLNCGLCPMQLDSYCPGCGGGEGNQSCKIAKCSIQHDKIEYCNQCQEFPDIFIHTKIQRRSRYDVDLKNNPESIFTQVTKRPTKFYLKGKDFTSDPEEIQEPDGSRETGRFHECDFYTDNTLKLFEVLKANPYKLYSFEM